MLIEFNVPSPVDVQALNIFCRCLCAYNVKWLREHPETPPLYQSGVRYVEQPIGVEQFKPIPLVLAAGQGDCNQLAPWRAAEIRVRNGIKALPEVKQMGPKLFHVFVRLPNGEVEDTSARLGMAVPERLAAIGRELLRKKGYYERRRNHPRPRAVVDRRFG